MTTVLTLALDDASQLRFESERQRLFPPELNRIPAHLTLFHTLPQDAATEAELATVAASTASFWLQVDAVRSIGRGVAYFAQSEEASALHRRLSKAFAPHLTPQDRQGFRPHIVVQNKVSAQVAQTTLESLQAGFTPFSVQAVGLDWWQYLGGPWQFLQRFRFAEGAGLLNL